MGEKTINFMREAMKSAVKAGHHGDVPIGAVIVRRGKIIARGENRVQKNSNPTKHAEMVAIRAACKKLEKKFLDDCEIFVSLEPCAMCAAAISYARIKRLTYAAADPKGGAVENGVKIYENDRHLFVPEIGKDSEFTDMSANLLKGFFKKLRAGRIKAITGTKLPQKSVKERAKAIKKSGVKK